MARQVKNILFIMFDQMRFDYLSCYGHPYLETPNMDWLASRGMRFSRAYVQSPVCGSSRMSYYTGRYPHSHGAVWNGFPLKVGELTLGDHMRDLGINCDLIGKTHMYADAAGMARLGIAADSVIGVRVAECGFDPYIRDDGLWPEGPDGFYDSKTSPYNDFLKSKGYAAENPWAEFANAGIDENGEIASAWFMKHAGKPANIREEDSETPWLTSAAIDYMTEREGGAPWLCHLSYIKPHWPYIVPAPYHNMYSGNQVLSPVRSEVELENPHPILAQYQNNVIGKAFQRDEVLAAVVPAYMGLIKQCDDQMGRLFKYLQETGRFDDTMIVICADHGDNLGDHWLGEKDMFHEPSVRTPLIVYDPRDSADATRGTVCDELVEAIDLTATFIEAVGGQVPNHIVEGRSLQPFLHGDSVEEWREFAVSEYDYSRAPTAPNLGVAPMDARLFMIVDKRWKYIHPEGGFRPLLFDLENDPNEFHDLGESSDHEEVRAMMYERLSIWARRQSQRTTLSDEFINKSRGGSRRKGIVLGVFDESEVAEDIAEKFQGPASQRYVD